jgi:hypothetical protein
MIQRHRWRYLAVLLALAFFVPVMAQEESGTPEGDQDDKTLRERIEERLEAARAEARERRGETAEPAGETEARGGQRESTTGTGDRETTIRTGDRETTRTGNREEQARRRERILRTILLPGTAEEAAESGVPEEDVEEVLKTAQEEGISPADTQVVMEGGADAARDGDYKNFGKFVNAKLEEGLRGRELAEAIHAEKAARGKGGKGHGKGRGKPHSRGHGDDDGRDDDHQGEGRDDDDDELNDQDGDERDEGRGKGKSGKKGNKGGKGKGKGKKND